MRAIIEVCDSCGIKAHLLTEQKRLGRAFDLAKFQSKFTLSTYHEGKCDICGQVCSVTEPRDFFYPDFKLLKKFEEKI